MKILLSRYQVAEKHTKRQARIRIPHGMEGPFSFDVKPYYADPIYHLIASVVLELLLYQIFTVTRLSILQ